MSEREQSPDTEPTPEQGLPEGGEAEQDRRHAVLEAEAERQQQEADEA